MTTIADSAREQVLADLAAFRSLANFSPIGIYRTDANGLCEYVNPRWEEISGLTSEEARVHGWTNAIHPDDRPAVLTAWDEAVRRKEEFAMEFRLGPDPIRYIHSRAAPVRGADGELTGWVGTVEDVTAQHQAEETRKKAERELDRFFNLSLDLLAIASADGWFRRLNPAFETVLGYSIEELVSRPGFEFMHPDDREPAIAEVTRLREGHQTVHYESRWICRDGSVKWIAWTASSVPEEGVIYAAGRDITALRENEMRTRAVIANALGAMITTDKHGLLESVNPAGERMFGYRADQLFGRSVALLYAGDVDLASVVKSSLGRVTRWMGRRATGEEFPCELSLFEFHTGTSKHFAAHIVDISDRDEAEKMKRDFVATISHELRTPLTSIRGSLGLLASGALGALPSEAQKLVEVAERNAMRLVSLINDILDFEKLDSGTIELELAAVPIARVLERSIEMIGPTAAQDAVTVNWDACPLEVNGDEMRLQQVMVNLLSNAVKYSPRGGRVYVKAAPVDGAIEVRVTDRGPGISPEAQKKLFQRFHQVDATDSRSKRGTGLGLAICKAIVEQHGGAIGVESRVGEGSTFWFRVPAISEERP